MHDLLARRWKFLALRCENVPAFWAVYALILVETIGEGVLAIPIAVAKIGPLAGIGILIVIGVVNALTILSLAEASARNGSVMYGVAYLGRVVQDYLGRTWAFVVVIAVTVIQILALVSYYVGFSTTMAEATQLPAAVWAGAIFLVCFYFLRKGSFASATGVVFLIGGLNVATVLVLLVMTIPHVHLENVLYTGFSLDGTKAFDPSWLQLVFGVIFSAYLGHLGVVNGAQFALRRDTSARSLVWGSVAAQLTLIVIYSLWVVAVNGAIDPSVLAAQSGTALVPLASQLGPLVYVLGSALIFLGIGAGSIVTALGLFCLVKEWLPKASLATASPREGGRRPTAASSLFHRRWQFWWAATPVIVIFGYVEWLLLTGRQSFTNPLSFLGVLAAPLIAGVFPLLLLVASRAKGDRPMRWYPGWLENPLVIGGIYVVFAVSLFVHGFLIWQGPVERFAAQAIGVGVLAVPIILIRQGAFASRTVIELRREAIPESKASLAIVTSGQPMEARVRIEYGHYGTVCCAPTGLIADFASLRRVQIRFLARTKELKIWVHRITVDGDSEGIPIRLTVASAGRVTGLELRDLAGKAVVPITEGPIDLEMDFAPQSLFCVNSRPFCESFSIGGEVHMALRAEQGGINYGSSSEEIICGRNKVAPSFRRNCRAGGFSLLEVLSVSALIVLMAGIFYSSISSFSSSGGRRGAVNVLMNTLELARIAALESAQTVYVGFADDDFPVEEMRYKAFLVFRETSDEERAKGARDYLVLRKWTRLPGNVAMKRVIGSLVPESGGQTFPGLNEVLPNGQYDEVFPSVAFNSSGAVAGASNPIELFLYEGHFGSGNDIQTRPSGELFEKISLSRYTGRAQFNVTKTDPQ